MTVTVSVRDARDTEGDRLWIQSVYRDYLDDLAPIGGTGKFPALGEVGHRAPDQLFHWFGDPNSFPLVILRASEPVGFALVVRGKPGAFTRRSAVGSAAATPAAQGRAQIEYRMRNSSSPAPRAASASAPPPSG
jgi:hypothetical protein